jgi:hypothetical protein
MTIPYTPLSDEVGHALKHHELPAVHLLPDVIAEVEQVLAYKDDPYMSHNVDDAIENLSILIGQLRTSFLP